MKQKADMQQSVPLVEVDKLRLKLIETQMALLQYQHAEVSMRVARAAQPQANEEESNTNPELAAGRDYT